MSNSQTSGFGQAAWWGFTPAIDFQDPLQHGDDISRQLESLSVKDDAGSGAKLTVLQVGAGDPRHLFLTFSRLMRHPRRNVEVHVIEAGSECLARVLLLLAIATEDPNVMGLQEKTETFLELFGNGLVRAKTADYLKQKATELIKMVTDDAELARRMPFCDISQLKFKDRDVIESVLNTWRGKDPFDFANLWDERLRQYYGLRYDARLNVVDWDYSMKLLEMAPIIAPVEFREWRQSCIAYAGREGAYTLPNRTLATRVAAPSAPSGPGRLAYLGDVAMGPYACFGIVTEHDDLLKKANDKFVYGAQAVSERNVAAAIHELYTGTPYSAEHAEQPRPRKAEDGKEPEAASASTDCTKPNDATHTSADGSASPLKGGHFTIKFLSPSLAVDLESRAKHAQQYDVAYYSNTMVHHLRQGIAAVLKDNALVIVESARFILDLRKEQVAEYLKRVVGMAAAAGCQPIVGPKDTAQSIVSANYAVFRHNRKSSS